MFAVFRLSSLLLLCGFLLAVKAEEDSVGTARDSYLAAFKATHTLNKHLATAKSSREATFFPEQNGYPHPVYKPQEEYGPPKDVYGPPKDNYGPPKDLYGPPKDVYGPPKDIYGPPKDTYGPPQGFEPTPDVYGPPKVTPVYGPPSYSYQPAPVYGPPMDHSYGIPHGMLGILDKIKVKLDLFTIGKIILKLVIFKKIVSLIAILCLLLFIPSLKEKHQDDGDADDEMRNFRENTSSIDNVSSFVLEAINSFNGKYDKEDCNTVYCKSKEMNKYLDRKITYKKLFQMYRKDE
ncbi:PREDICTED: uncharacterized protein LOC108562419 isoform X2 [Nicrophorus vespilloides]|uniref:Uncharacterized protein LOC108562419 isoform X2 n=1 Tax=Nicrophorus vespilloides TaxID=110193 RepID=A0ABM1MNU3_NICVS|nr:PREDICTED: uncharacterized protein LOC108562419 isoform X2 [Nicrophorus vespilloides]